MYIRTQLCSSIVVVDGSVFESYTARESYGGRLLISINIGRNWEFGSVVS